MAVVPPAERLNLNSKVKAGEPILQLKIEMTGLHHTVWRRVLVPSGATFVDLHLTIQGLFQWRNYHLFHFKKRGYTIDPNPKASGGFGGGWGDEEMLDAKTTLLKAFLKKEKDNISYEYDFGDSWDHVIRVEKLLLPEEGKIYPVCTAGKRKGPPEDCGSSPGYEDLCQALGKTPAERTTDEKEQIEWLNECYSNYGDPEQFSPEDCKFREVEYYLE